MRESSKVILRQLENEGVKYEQMWGCHWLSFGSRRPTKDVIINEDFRDAVDDALSRAIRITALLSKLQDAILAEIAQGGKT